jgi:3-phenylpropionate/cinnamic acid dioxygenase small subunit
MQAVDEKTPVAKAGKSIAYGESLYNEAMHFLIEEAGLLDDGLFNEWLEKMADDIRCIMPVRQSLNSQSGSGFDDNMIWLDEDKATLSFKVQRLYGGSAWAEDPPSRVRRLITNLRLYETTNPTEYLAKSYLLIQRSRGDAHQFDTFSARREDVLRQTNKGWQLARRTVYVDQTVLGLANLAIFV